MNGWYNPDSWIDIVDHVILALAGLACVVIPTYLHNNRKTLKQVRDQVVNSHPDRNLRDDLDRCLAAIEALAHDVNGLRKDLLRERDSRHAQVSDLADTVDRMRRR